MSMPVTITMFAIAFIFWPTESWPFDRKEITKISQDVMNEQTISMDVLKKSFSPNWWHGLSNSADADHFSGCLYAGEGDIDSAHA